MPHNEIVQELELVRIRCGGVLKAESVVEYARDPNTALHDRFEWDDTEAARQHRIWQARELIRVSVTVLPNTTTQTRAYVSLQSDRETVGGGYRPIAEVLSDTERRKELLGMALGDMRRWRDRYRELTELGKVFEAIDDLENGEEVAA
jgi:hypothetical protein